MKSVRTAAAVLEFHGTTHGGAVDRAHRRARAAATILGLNRQRATERVESKQRIRTRHHRRRCDGHARNEVPTHDVAKRLVEPYTVHVDRQALRSTQERRSGVAPVVQIRLKGIALHLVDEDAIDPPVQKVGEVECPARLDSRSLCLFLVELPGRDLVALLDGLVADQLRHLQHVHVVVDERQGREGLEVVAVERQDGTEMGDRLPDVLPLLAVRAGATRPIAQDLSQVVARLDRVQGIDLDGALEQRLGAARVALAPRHPTQVGDRGAVLRHLLPDADGIALLATLLQHGALIEAGLDDPGALVGDLAEVARQARTLAVDVAGLLCRQVAVQDLLELGARVLGDLTLGRLRDQLVAAGQLALPRQATTRLLRSVFAAGLLRTATATHHPRYRQGQGECEARWILRAHLRLSLVHGYSLSAAAAAETATSGLSSVMTVVGDIDVDT